MIFHPLQNVKNGLPGMLKNLANPLKYSRICKQVPLWSKIREFCMCLTHSNFLDNSLSTSSQKQSYCTPRALRLTSNGHAFQGQKACSRRPKSMLLAKQGHQKVIFEAKLGLIFSRMQVLK